MNLPTQHQLVVAGSAVGVFTSGALAMFGFVHIIDPTQVADATQAISMIGEGLGKVMTGVGTMVGIGIAAYNTISSSPFASLFRASKDIASDPVKLEQLKTASIDQQAPLVVVTDKLPDVAGVGTTQTQAGKALATAVPSVTVQSVSSIQPAMAKGI
jgi:hypothetical protein